MILQTLRNQIICWIFRYQALILTLLIVINVPNTAGKLITRPDNMAVVVGSTVTFHCLSEKPFGATEAAKFEWHAHTSSSGANFKLFVGSQSQTYTTNRNRFQLTTTGGRYDLTVMAVQLDDSGLYVCNVTDDHASAYLVVLANAAPSCFANITITADASHQLVEGDTIRFTCSVEQYVDLFKFLPPRYRWTSTNFALSVLESTSGTADIKVSAPESSAQRQSFRATSGVATCTMYFDQPTRNFNDTARNAPSYRKTCVIPITPNANATVNYAPRNVTIESSANGNRTYFVGDAVVCSADGYPPPVYQWSIVGQDEVETKTGTGQALNLSQLGRIRVRCNASNTIRNVVRHAISDIVNLTVIEKLVVSTGAPGTKGSDDISTVADHVPIRDNWNIIILVVGVGLIVFIITVTIAVAVCVVRCINVLCPRQDQRMVDRSTTGRDFRSPNTHHMTNEKPELVSFQQLKPITPDEQYQLGMSDIETEQINSVSLYDEIDDYQTIALDNSTAHYCSLDTDLSRRIASKRPVYTTIIA